MRRVRRLQLTGSRGWNGAVGEQRHAANWELLLALQGKIRRL